MQRQAVIFRAEIRKSPATISTARTSARGQLVQGTYAASRTRICTFRPTDVAMLTSVSRPKRSIFPRIKSDTRGCVTPSRSAGRTSHRPALRIDHRDRDSRGRAGRRRRGCGGGGGRGHWRGRRGSGAAASPPPPPQAASPSEREQNSKPIRVIRISIRAPARSMRWILGRRA
jgi:hypothetical protein